MTESITPDADPEWSPDDLRRRQFALHYVDNGFNVPKASAAMGIHPASGYTILRDPETKAHIEAVADEFGKITGLSIERTLRELARIAYGDIRGLYHEDGRLKKVHELNDDQATMIAGLEFDAETGVLTKVKTNDKNAAIEKALKVLQLYVDKVQVDQSVTVKVIDYSSQHAPKV